MYFLVKSLRMDLVQMMELSLGRNLTIAYMPWEGYYEDYCYQ
jgi:DNA-directed RNA polymerase beta subunit